MNIHEAQLHPIWENSPGPMQSRDTGEGRDPWIKSGAMKVALPASPREGGGGKLCISLAAIKTNNRLFRRVSRMEPDQVTLQD